VTTNSFAPIAVFAYNRPDKLAAMLESLQRCNNFSSSPVTIFVDGPRSLSDNHAVASVRSLVRSLALENVTGIVHDSNRGLRNSIFDGVTKLVEDYGRVIVLEDDLVLSPIALDFFNSALQHYHDVDKVWSICGYTYDVPKLRSAHRTLTLPFTHPWGWATWARAWNRFDLDNRPSEPDIRSRSFRMGFDMGGVYPFTAQLQNSISGRVNSWFIHWYYTVFQHGGVSIFPPRRVVDNFGFNDGSHGGSLNPQEILVKRPRMLESAPVFSDPDMVDYSALDALRRCRELRVQRLIAHAGSARRKILRSRAR